MKDFEREVVSVFGGYLFELRKKFELSQERLADQAGLDRNYIGQIERGVKEPCLASIVRIALGFGMSPSDMLKGFDDAAAMKRVQKHHWSLQPTRG